MKKTFLLLIVLLITYTGNSQNKKQANSIKKNPIENNQTKLIMKKINTIAKEYVFSIGVSKYEPFILNGYIIKQSVNTFDLRKVKVSNGGRVATGRGLEFECYKVGSDCIKSIDSDTKEVSYSDFIVYPIDDDEVIVKLVKEFCRIKSILKLKN